MYLKAIEQQFRYTGSRAVKVERFVTSATRNIRLNVAASVGITEAGNFDLVGARSDTWALATGP
jgi:hypothetical protein